MGSPPLKIAWISDFPVERLEGAPEVVRKLPGTHPLTWQKVLLPELAKREDLQLHIVVLRKHLEKNLVFEKEGSKFHLIKVPARLRATSLFWIDTFLINRVLADIKPDLVHAWGTEQGAGLVATRLNYPHLISLQGLISWQIEVARMPLYYRFAAWWEKKIFQRAKFLTAESVFVTRYLRERYSGKIWQVEHAPNWIFHKLNRRPQLDPIRFIFVGVFSHLKGSDLLLGALEKLKSKFPMELVIVGNCQSRFWEKIKNQTSQELRAKIDCKGNLSPEQLVRELEIATMMIFPTRGDNSPNSVKEAVVAGVPVIASSVGGIPDYVFPEKNGCLFTSGDLAGCIQAIERACNHPLFRHGLVDKETLEKNRAYLSPRLMGEKFSEIYHLLVQQSRPGNEGRAQRL